MEVNKVYNTDALTGLRGLPDGSVDMCFKMFGDNKNIPKPYSDDNLFINLHYNELKKLHAIIANWLEEHSDLREDLKV